MPVDVDLANWNKENGWPHSFTPYQAEPLIGIIANEEENGEYLATTRIEAKTPRKSQENDSNNNGQKAEAGLTKSSRKRMREEEIANGFLEFYGWWHEQENKGKGGTTFGNANVVVKPAAQQQQHNSQPISNVSLSVPDDRQSTSTSTWTIPSTSSSSKPPLVRVSRKGQRVVLGELLDYALSPFNAEGPEEKENIGGWASRMEGIYV